MTSRGGSTSDAGGKLRSFVLRSGWRALPLAAAGKNALKLITSFRERLAG